MPFKVEMLPDEPIVLVSVTEPFDLKADIHAFVDDLLSALDRASQPVYEVMDVRALKLSFSTIVDALALTTRSDSVKRIDKHPKLKAWIIVLDNDLLRIGANALGQDQYGGKAVPIFPTLEQALDYARQQNRIQAVQD